MLGYSKRFPDTSHRPPLKVQADRITRLQRIELRTHVYTLETSEGWYTANGFVVSNCRPPGNRDPEISEALACAPFLHLQILIIRPKVIVTLGGIAGRFLTGESEDAAVGYLRNHDWRYENETAGFSCPIVPTYHPSYIYRNKTENPKAAKEAAIKVIFDLQKAIRISEGL